jgi:hypothetical protein
MTIFLRKIRNKKKDVIIANLIKRTREKGKITTETRILTITLLLTLCEKFKT